MSRGLAAALAALACAATMAGCGGGDGEAERRAEPPKIPSDVVDGLAERSDAIADKLEAGDVCGAALEADALVNEARAAVDAGEVPARYEDELIATAVELQNTVNCPPPPPPQPEEEEEEDEEGKGDGKGKGDGQGKGSPEVGTTITLGDD
jgi:hypothetical protein